MQNTTSTEHLPRERAASGAFAWLTATEPRWTLLIFRLTLGVMIVPHGAQKLLGWFGGYGFAGTMGYFTETLGIPYVFGLLAIIAEFFGGLALLVGLFTRTAALGVGVTMLVAAVVVHAEFGFFMNWAGGQAGEGFEFHLLAIAIAVALIIGGGGPFSVDRILARR